MNRREAIKLITGSVPGLAIAGREFKQEPPVKIDGAEHSAAYHIATNKQWVAPKCTHLFIYMPRISSWQKAELKKAFEKQYKGVSLSL